MGSANESISLFIYSFAGGGAEAVMVTLANELDSRGYSVEVLVVEPTGPNADRLNPEIPITIVGGTNVLTTTIRLANRLQRSQPDVLFSTMEMPNVMAVLATRFPVEIPVIIESVSVTSKRDRANKYRLIPPLKRAVYPFAEAIVTVSDGVARELAVTTGIDPDKMTTIYNPAYDPNIPELAADPVDHPWFDEETPLVVGVGNLKPAKDFPTLLRAVARLPKMRLVILGRGSDRDDLERLAAELGIEGRVDFPGFVDNPYAYMAKADVFALSSAWEGFGNVLVEAMACGTPVVSTDCPGGPAEILNNEEYGSLVPVGDDEAMAKAIKDVLANPTESSLLQSRAKDFAIEPIVDQYEDVLLSVIE